MKSYTKYYCSKEEGMRLRSGTVINCSNNDKNLVERENALANAFRICQYGGYENKCIVFRACFDLFEDYHDVLKNEKKYKGFYSVIRNKFNQFPQEFNKHYNKSKSGQPSLKAFCRCCIKHGANPEDVKNKLRVAFDMVHDEEETYKQIVKWRDIMNEPPKKLKEIYKFLAAKTNQDCRDMIFAYAV